jgi:glycine/D-amino acid oxidase-like deaminating enzyme
MESRAQIPVGPPVTDPLPSYWHNVGQKSPLTKLIEPEIEDVTSPREYDHCIIGSGISGTLIAYNLLNANPESRIVMLEAREACGGATGRNGGHTKAASYRTYLQHREELGKEEALKIARLEFENIKETHELVNKLALKCEANRCNTVDLIYDQDTFDSGKAAIEQLRADTGEKEREEGGMAWYKMYDPDEATQNFWAAKTSRNPALEGDEDLVGAFEYAAGRINAYRFTTDILKECTKKGLVVGTHRPVHSIRRVNEPNVDSPTFEVFTQYATVTARNIILATNGYTPYLLPKLQGVIVPLRGQITAQKPGISTQLPSPLPNTYSFIYKSGYEYMIPRSLPEGGQHIVIGGGLGREPQAGAGEYGTVNDSVLNESMSAYLKGSLTGYFGDENWGERVDEDSERVVQEWTGIMGATADGRPFVGEIPGEPGMWISAGFNGHGMVLCLKSAEALAQLIGGNSPKSLEWFPNSFLISEDRIANGGFRGRMDMTVPETGGRSIEQ